MPLFNVIITNLFLSETLMKKYELKESSFGASDPVENYFECISSCDIADGICISKCVEKLKDDGN